MGNFNKTEMIITSEHELVKQYQLLDLQNRPSKVYTAPTNAKSGDPCIVTEYIYADAITTLVQGKTQGYDVWDESWVPDANFTVTVAEEMSKTELLILRTNELTKEFQLLDGQNRPFKVFQASVIAKTGSPCIVTEYIYQNPTSTTLKGRKEAYSTWDESWVPDSAFTVDYL